MKRPEPLRYAYYGVIFYLILAFGWWTILLHIKNQDAFKAKSEYRYLIEVAEGNPDRTAFENSEQYLDLKWEYDKDRYMIYSEAVFFIISLFGGIYFMNRGYFRELNAEKQHRNFMLSITHELKSPIASVKLALQTKQRRNLSSEKNAQLTQLALKENQRLGSLVDNILLASKIESNFQLNVSPTDVNRMIRDLADDFVTKNENLALDLDLEPNLPKVKADETAMLSILLNLIENAIKYGSKDKEVFVKSYTKDKSAVVEVKDLGIGISNQEKKNIFTKFYRVGNEDTRTTKGTGLGLYLVKELIRLQNGKITVMDNSPRGSIFKIELPLE